MRARRATLCKKSRGTASADSAQPLDSFLFQQCCPAISQISSSTPSSGTGLRSSFSSPSKHVTLQSSNYQTGHTRPFNSPHSMALSFTSRDGNRDCRSKEPPRLPSAVLEEWKMPILAPASRLCYRNPRGAIRAIGAHVES